MTSSLLPSPLRIEPIAGYSPAIGRLVGMLTYARSTTFAAVEGLNTAELDHLHDGESNSIGALLAHITAVERSYQILTFEDRLLSSAENERWSAALKLGPVGRRELRGHPLEHYLDELTSVRRVTLEMLATRDDVWLERSVTQAPKINAHWAWFHAAEDEVNHRGQIRWLRTRLPKRDAASYKARILSYQAGADFLALQAAAPETLANLVQGLSPAQLARRPAPDKWSIQEVVAHLADDELVGGYRLRMILSAPGTAIQAFDQDVWARTGRYGQRDVHSSLERFRVLRQANLELLRSLSADEWDMYGVHAERGVESIRDIAMYFAGHDINHFKQIEAIRHTDHNRVE